MSMPGKGSSGHKRLRELSAGESQYDIDNAEDDEPDKEKS